jgi:hypothetical protein
MLITRQQPPMMTAVLWNTHRCFPTGRAGLCAHKLWIPYQDENEKLLRSQAADSGCSEEPSKAQILQNSDDRPEGSAA